MLSVIVSGCPSGLIASRETKTERKKVKLVKIHCKTLTNPMNPDVIMGLKISIEKHNGVIVNCQQAFMIYYHHSFIML